eukprot:COSAG01_NODE_34674_length_543_cov_4.680180_1_plen_22_part_10
MSVTRCIEHHQRDPRAADNLGS